MKKLLTGALLVLIFLTSCRISFVNDIMEGYDSNPFAQQTSISKDGKSDDEIRFLIFSDAHINRIKEDWGVTDNTPLLRDYLGNNKTDIDFVISLGDIEDAGDINAPELHDFLSFFENERITFVTCMGNHELQLFHERDEWNRLYSSYGLYGTLGCYTYDDLSIYALDSTKRIYGKKQLEWLEEALKEDTNKYKIAITHTNTYSGNRPDASLLFYGTADIAERNRLYRIFTENGLNMLFNGHFHTGNILTRHSAYLTEFNLAALHTRDQIPGFFYPGYFYICTLNKAENTLTLDYFKIEGSDITKEKSEVFTLQFLP